MSVAEPKRDRRTPGRVLSDLLADKKLSHVQASAAVNGVLSPARISAIVGSRSPITVHTAVVLERLTGRGAEEWLLHYLADELRIERAKVDAEIKARAKQSAANANAKPPKATEADEP